MKKNRGDILLLVFIFITLVLAVLYFSVPERILFLENQLNWWNEFRDIMLK
jgi:hypothetical protein